MNSKRKILIFIDWYKPGYKAGGPIRSISNIVDYLHEKADLFIITRNNDYLETTPFSTVTSNKWNNIDNSSVYYLSKDNINYKNIKRLIIEIDPDLIYCNSLYSPFFSLIPLYLAKKFNVNSVLAVRGMLSKGSLGIKSKKKKLFLFLTRIIGLFRRCTFHATNNNEEKEIFNTFGNAVKTFIAQNLPEKKNVLFYPKKKDVGQLKLVSVGRIAPEKNTLFALEVLKNVKANIEFDIFGPIYNEDYWMKCKKIIYQLPDNVVVNYNGALPHSEIDEKLKNFHVLFLPSTGENFGHIIIEAMINTCIPVISDKTPWKNLEQQNIGFDISLETKVIFAEKIDLLAKLNERSFNNMASNAHHFASNIIDDEVLINDYYKLFQLKN